MLSLARTRNGDFLGACALDFDGAGTVRGLYSTSDADGRKATSAHWPYFESRASKKALMARKEVPVHSCFGGMGRFPASRLCVSGPNSLDLRFRLKILLMFPTL